MQCFGDAPSQAFPPSARAHFPEDNPADAGEQLAKAAVAKRPKVLGRPDRVEVALRFTLSRAAMERLTAQAIREGRSVESLVSEMLDEVSAAEARFGP